MTAATIDSLRHEIAHLLDQAGEAVVAGQMDRAAWRIADAGGLARELAESMGLHEGLGIDEPSGRGYELPRRVAQP